MPKIDFFFFSKSVFLYISKCVCLTFLEKVDFLASFKQVAVWNYIFFPRFLSSWCFTVFNFLQRKYIIWPYILLIILNEKFFLKKLQFDAILYFPCNFMVVQRFSFKHCTANAFTRKHLWRHSKYMVNFSPYIHTMYYYILTYCKSIVSMQRNYGIHGMIFFKNWKKN